MTVELLRCPNCAGELHFANTSPMTTCAHCGAQLALHGTAAPGATLADAIYLKVTPTFAIELVKAAAPLPVTITETIAVQRDQQAELHVDLQLGRDSNPAHNRDLIAAVYALTKPPARGMPAAQLKLTVTVTGEVALEVREEGTTNVRTFTARAPLQ